MQDRKPASPTKEVWPSQDTLKKEKARRNQREKGKEERRDSEHTKPSLEVSQ